jgi:hypothetical protein
MRATPFNQQPEFRVSRWDFLRDVAVLQLKLIVDGLRDLILVPASLVVALVSLMRGGNDTGREFYELLQYGRRTEEMIDLFGALKKRGLEAGKESHFESIDEIADRIEAFIVHEYNKGGVTHKAKQRLDRALDALQKRGKQAGDEP